MEFRWRAIGGPTLNAGLVALWFYRGSGPLLLRNPIFCDPPVHPLDPHMRFSKFLAPIPTRVASCCIYLILVLYRVQLAYPR